MIRRSIHYVSILLICAFAVSCSKSDKSNATLYEKDEIDFQEEEEIALSEVKQEKVDIGGLDGANHTELEEDSKEEEESLEENDAYVEVITAPNLVLLSELIREESKINDIRVTLKFYPAGTILDTRSVDDDVLEGLFYSEEISDDVKDRITGKSYGDKCEVPYSELSYLRVLYRGFDELTHIGELVVNPAIAEDIIDIMKELYEIDYPIERMVLVDEYNADDISSMEANNTSSFNYRTIDRSTKLSKHSYGLAIDINPRYNPYVRVIEEETVVLPENGREYADRNKDNPYYIKEGDPCWSAFTERGFTWGGAWKSQKDYQHFEKTPDMNH